MKTVAAFLEMALAKPVLDQTGLTGLYDVDLQWKLSAAEKQKPSKPDPDAVVAAAHERLGLRLTLVQRPVEIIEVGKATP